MDVRRGTSNTGRLAMKFTPS